MTGGARPTLARAFRRVALPLGWYYAITLALPFANGAAQSGTVFVEQALVVLVLPPLLIALAWAAHRLAHSFRRVDDRDRRERSDRSRHLVPHGGGEVERHHTRADRAASRRYDGAGVTHLVSGSES
jgi:hypothetical protein